MKNISIRISKHKTQYLETGHTLLWGNPPVQYHKHFEQRLFHQKLKFKMALSRDGFHQDFATYLKYCRIFVRLQQKVL